nr:hypothetical protein [Tanacetum cinerariifolium]
MIAILEKTEHNIDFHQIVDFLEASHIKYALTISPTVYVLHIRQFWSTARIKTTNEETKILATADGKPRTISKSSLRRHLKLNDEEGISSLPDTELFKNLSLMIAQSKALSPAADKPTSLIRNDSQGEAFPIVSSLDARQDRENINKTSALPYESSPRVTSLDADEGTQDFEISGLKERVKLLEDKDRGSAEPSREGAPIKRGSIEIGEEVGVERSTELGSNDNEEMVNVLSSIEAANILTSGVATVSVSPIAAATTIGVLTIGVPTVSGLFPTVIAIFTTASVLARDSKIASLHTKEELKMMIEGMDRSNEMIAKHLTINLSMAKLALCDYHNMVAISEKTEYNTNFHQIVDFLEASHIRIEKTEEGTKILATVDGTKSMLQPYSSEVEFINHMLILKLSKSNKESSTGEIVSPMIVYVKQECNKFEHVGQEHKLIWKVKSRLWFCWISFDYCVPLGFGSIAGGLYNVNHVTRLPIECGISRVLGTMVGVDINTLTMEQYLALSRENQAPSVVKLEIRGNVNFEIKSQFMRELREDTLFGNKNKDAHDHVDRVLNIESFNKQTTLLEKQMDESISWDQKYPFIQNTIEANFCHEIQRINAGLEQFHVCLNDEMVADLRYFNSLEPEVDSLRSQLETQKTQFLNEIDRLSKEYYYANHMNAILGVYTELDKVTNLQCDYLELEKGIVISELKKLIEKLKGKSVDTKFEKSSVIRQPNAFKSQRPSILGKPTIFLDSLERKDFLKSKLVSKNNMSNDFSKPVTAHILPPNKKSILKNTNVLAPRMYKLHTKPTQTRTSQLPNDSRKTNKRVSFSTGAIPIGAIPITSVSRPQLKSNPMEDRVMLNNSQGKKHEVEDHRRNVNNGVNSRTKMPIVVPVSTRELKRTVTQSVAKPLRKTVDLESNQKPRNTLRKLYECVRLNHNLFSVGQFCDADLEVAFRKSTCYIRDLKGNDLLTVARTPEQNDVVERWKRTLVEAVRTMLSAAKVPLFFWAEAIATTCFTQNRSLGPTLRMTPTQALMAIQTIVDHSQKWHDGTSSRNISSISNTYGLDVVGRTTEVLQFKLLPKEQNPRNFTLPCTIGDFNFHVIANLGASVNFMPMGIFEFLKLTHFRKTNMLIEMVDMTKKPPLEMVENILVGIDKFLFPFDFVIINKTPNETSILGNDRIIVDIEKKDHNFMISMAKILMMNSIGLSFPNFLLVRYGGCQLNDLIWGQSYAKWYRENSHDNESMPRDYTFKEWMIVKVGHTNVNGSVKKDLLKSWVIDCFEDALDPDKDPMKRSFDDYK